MRILRLPSLLIVLSGFYLTSQAQNVGIGTVTPTKARLQITGVTNVSLLSTSTGDNTTGISISSPSTSLAAINFNLAWSNAYRLLATGYGANLNFSPSTGLLSYSNTTTKGNPGDLMFFSTNMYVDTNGYVGLGISSPKARLHSLNAVIGSSSITPATGYILSVGGKIICEELKVQLHASWPDYVFEKDYPMPSLEQVERDVMEMKHLPGIPSAAEINSQQGVEIGDLQKRMLEKMEELYKYLFEINRENKILKEKIAALESRETVFY